MIDTPATRLILALSLLLPAPLAAQVRVLDDVHEMLPADRDTPGAFAAGDVDGDGDLDLLAANGGISASFTPAEQPNRLLLNDGVGRYSSALGLLPNHVEESEDAALGDLDGDGDLDAVIANRGANRYYRGNGTGLFLDAGAALPAHVEPTNAVALGDVDGDGDLDVLLGNLNNMTNRLYRNDGAGNLADVTGNLPAHLDSTSDVLLGDVDGDGDLDAFVANGFENLGQADRFYLNAGTGSFFDAAFWLPLDLLDTRSAAFGDFDADGDLDVFVGKGIVKPTGQGSPLPDRLFLNGGGFFLDGSGLLPGGSADSRGAAVGDANGDGLDDLLVSRSGAGAALLLNTGGGPLVDGAAGFPVDGIVYTGLLVDVDGDGDDDAVLGHGPREQNRLHLNDGGATFTDVTDSFPGDFDDTQALALGDFDGDGLLDVLVGDDDANQLYLNDGSGPFLDASDQLPAASDNTRALAVADLDLDGDQDFVAGNFFDPSRVRLGDGAGGFVDLPGALPANQEATYALALGDMDGDGDPDLLLGNGNGQANRLFTNDGTGVFAEVSAALPAHADPTRAVALGDVDGDGDLDALIGNTVFGNYVDNRLYLNNGAGFTDAQATLSSGVDETYAVALGDVDGDGDLDAYFGNATHTVAADPQDRLFLNDAAGNFTDATALLPFSLDDTHSVALGDVDGDGHLDVFVGNERQADVVRLGDGTGAFAMAPPGFLPTIDHDTEVVVLGDLDGDGDLDALVGNHIREQNRMWTNLTRQVARRSTPRAGVPLTLELYGAPGGAWLLGVAGAPAIQPLPPFGTLRLDPGSLTLPAAGSLDGDGTAAATFAVAPNPALVGLTLYWQAAVDSPTLRLTNLDLTLFTAL